MLSIRPNFSRQLRSLNPVRHGFASKTPIEQGNKFLKSFKDLLTNLVFQKPPLILGNKKPEGIPIDALDTPSKQLGYMRMKISQIKIGNLNENRNSPGTPDMSSSGLTRGSPSKILKKKL